MVQMLLNSRLVAKKPDSRVHSWQKQCILIRDSLIENCYSKILLIQYNLTSLYDMSMLLIHKSKHFF